MWLYELNLFLTNSNFVHISLGTRQFTHQVAFVILSLLFPKRTFILFFSVKKVFLFIIECLRYQLYLTHSCWPISIWWPYLISVSGLYELLVNHVISKLSVSWGYDSLFAVFWRYSLNGSNVLKAISGVITKCPETHLR